jgi:hypothetical protein
MTRLGVVVVIVCLSVEFGQAGGSREQGSDRGECEREYRELR